MATIAAAGESQKFELMGELLVLHVQGMVISAETVEGRHPGQRLPAAFLAVFRSFVGTRRYKDPSVYFA